MIDSPKPPRTPGQPQNYTQEEVWAAGQQIKAEGRNINGESLRLQMKRGGRNALLATYKLAEAARSAQEAVANEVIETLSPAGETALATGLNELGVKLRQILVAVQHEQRAQAEEALLAIKAELAEMTERYNAAESVQEKSDLEIDDLRTERDEAINKCKILTDEAALASALAQDRALERDNAQAARIAAERDAAVVEAARDAALAELAALRATTSEVTPAPVSRRRGSWSKSVPSE